MQIKKILFLVIACIAASPLHSQEIDIRLDGQWKFSTGILEDALKPAFNDSAWKRVRVPAYWDTQGYYGFNGLALYRKTFTPPATATGKTLYLALGKIADIDEVYLNGTLCGRTGAVKEPRRNDERLYQLPADLLKYGQENVLAVRVFTHPESPVGGGIYEGIGENRNVIGIFTKTALRNVMQKPTALAPAAIADTVRRLIQQMDEALTKSQPDTYMLGVSTDYFNNGTGYDDQNLFVQSLVRSMQGTTLTYQNFTVYQAAPDRVVADYDTDIRKNGEPLYAAHDERTFKLEEDGWREIGNQSRYFDLEVRSAFLGELTPVTVYLPPSYLTNKDARYPILYLLHGSGGSNQSWAYDKVQAVLDSLMTSKEIMEMVVAMPSGGQTFFVNSKDGKKKFEDFFLQELPEGVEPDFRVIRSRDARAIDGVSLGGFGAFMLALKTEQGRSLFGSVGSMMGALGHRIRNEPQADGGDSTFWTPYMPTNIVRRLPADTLKKFDFYFNVGEDDALRKGNELMHALLDKKKIPHTFKLYEGKHERDFWVAHFAETLRFHSDNFKRRLAPPKKK